MSKTWTDFELENAFWMPKAKTITFRTSTLANAFASAIIPFIKPTSFEIRTVLEILAINPKDLRCAYCGEKATECDHLHPIVSKHRPSGFPSTIKNLVPSCSKCNQSKGGKAWRNWIKSDAKLSPKSRRIADLDERISRLDNYDKWANCSPMPVEQVVGKQLYEDYFRKLDNIVTEMKKAQDMATKLKEKLR